MAKFKKPSHEEVATVANKFPLVSVIIPMYNSAKFITQTLESLVRQTMTNFEIVIVDDCSTDNSIEVVKGFADRFGRRLHVIRLNENSGTPNFPRNVGIQYAHGKYVAFLDSDDLFTPTALEEQVTLAEKYKADVVHMDATFNLWDNQPKSEDDPAMTDMDALLDKSNMIIWTPPAAQKLQEPTFDPLNLAERLKLWLKYGWRWVTYSSFCRRDFLIANQIFFPDMLGGGDMLFSFKILCTARKILRVPNITYIIRPRAGSVSREKSKFDVPKYLHKWINTFITGTNEYDKIMRRMEFFKKRPDYRYAVTGFFFRKTLRMIPTIYSKIQAFKLNEIVKREFHPDDAVFAAYLFNTVNVQRLQLARLQRELNALKKSK